MHLCAREIIEFDAVLSPSFSIVTLSSVESFLLLHKRFTACQSSKDNRPIVLPLFLMLLYAKDIWPNTHVFQHGTLFASMCIVYRNDKI